MATKTAGTLATSTLTAIQWFPGTTSAADLATVAQGIYIDGGFGAPDGLSDGRGNRPGQIMGEAFSTNGLLYVPGRRGPLIVYPGDWVANDGFGNVFLIPQRALPKTLTASVTLANASNIVTSATDIRTYGWQVGTHVTSSHTPANSVIGTIGPDGKSFTLVTINANQAPTASNATGSATETMTAGTFTHS